MFKVVICEDNSIYRKHLERYIDKINRVSHYEYKLTLSTSKPEEVLQHLSEEETFILFLDIELGETINGYDLALQCKSINNRIYIIFISEHVEYVFESFKVRPIDFLPKPVSYQQFYETTQRVEEQERLFQEERCKYSDNAKIRIKSGSVSYDIFVNDIIYIEKIQNKCVFHMTKQIISTYKTLQECQELLEIYPYIKQCHRGFLVNKNKVMNIDYNSKKISLASDKVCYIGKKFSREFKI